MVRPKQYEPCHIYVLGWWTQWQCLSDLCDFNGTAAVTGMGEVCQQAHELLVMTFILMLKKGNVRD